MVGYDPEDKQLSHKAQLFAGALSGVLTRACTQPIDVLKIRFQLQVEPISPSNPASKYQGSIQTIRTIIKEETWTAFLKGHIASQMLSAVYMATEFASFEILTKYLYLNYHGSHNKSVQHFIGGAGAGATATIVSYPFDVIRTRLVAQGNVKMYTGICQAFHHIYRVDGIAGYYRGLFAAICHTAPQSALYFGLYHLYKKTLSVRMHNQPDLVTAIAGAVAGISSKLVTYPFDTSKRRLQVVGFESVRRGFGETRHYTGVRHHLITSLKEEGIAGLYKGVMWSLIKSGVSTSMYFFIYEKFCAMVKHNNSSIN